jgi:hypothetical protein
MPFFPTKSKYNKEGPRQTLLKTHKYGSSLNRAHFTPSAFASTRSIATILNKIASTSHQAFQILNPMQSGLGFLTNIANLTMKTCPPGCLFCIGSEPHTPVIPPVFRFSDMEGRTMDSPQSPTLVRAAEEEEEWDANAEDIEDEGSELDLTLTVLKDTSKDIMEEQRDLMDEMVFVWQSQLVDVLMEEHSCTGRNIANRCSGSISEKQFDPVAVSQQYSQSLIDLWNEQNEDLVVLHRQFLRTKKLSEAQGQYSVALLQKSDFTEGEDECRTALRANLGIGLEPELEVWLRGSVFLLGQQMRKDWIYTGPTSEHL